MEVEMKQAGSRRNSSPPCRRPVCPAEDERSAPGESVADTRTLGVPGASRLPLKDAGPKHRAEAEAEVRGLCGAEDTRPLALILVAAATNTASIENELVRDRHHVSTCYGAGIEHLSALVHDTDLRHDPLVHRAICEVIQEHKADNLSRKMKHYTVGVQIIVSPRFFVRV